MRYLNMFFLKVSRGFLYGSYWKVVFSYFSVDCDEPIAAFFFFFNSANIVSFKPIKGLKVQPLESIGKKEPGHLHLLYSQFLMLLHKRVPTLRGRLFSRHSRILRVTALYYRLTDSSQFSFWSSVHGIHFQSSSTCCHKLWFVEPRP